jgi:hypothetical protein
MGTAKEPIMFQLFKFGGNGDEGQFNLLIILTVMAVMALVLIASSLLKYKLSLGFAKLLFVVYLITLAVSFGGFFYINR